MHFWHFFRFCLCFASTTSSLFLLFARLSFYFFAKSQLLAYKSLILLLLCQLFLTLHLPVFFIFQPGSVWCHCIHHSVADKKEANKIFLFKRIFFFFRFRRFSLLLNLLLFSALFFFKFFFHLFLRRSSEHSSILVLLWHIY